MILLNYFVIINSYIILLLVIIYISVSSLSSNWKEILLYFFNFSLIWTLDCIISFKKDETIKLSINKNVSLSIKQFSYILLSLLKTRLIPLLLFSFLCFWILEISNIYNFYLFYLFSLFDKEIFFPYLKTFHFRFHSFYKNKPKILY